MGEAPLETVKRYSSSNYSDPCIITGLAMATLHIKMLRMTHLGNKLLVLLVQISSRRHIVSPYSQPALLGKPGNKARVRDHSLTGVFHLSPAAPQKQMTENPTTLPCGQIQKKDHRQTRTKPNCKCKVWSKQKKQAVWTLFNKLMNGPLRPQYSSAGDWSPQVHRNN